MPRNKKGLQQGGGEMSKEQTTAVAKARNPDELTIVRNPDESDATAIARTGLSPEVKNARTAQIYARGGMGVLHLSECVEALKQRTAAIKGGDMSEVEATLAAQAVALDSIFNEMARRASLNLGEYLDTAETYMRMALKAQAQCRATLQTLGEIKNPRPVAFVKQANIAHGPQQVNNGAMPAVDARAEKSEPQQNELLECSKNDEWLAPRATGATGGGNSDMAAMAEL